MRSTGHFLPAQCLLASVVLSSIAGCGAAPTSDESWGVSESELLRKTSDTGTWRYQGPMPRLDEARITVSLAGHTARVTGLVPLGFTGSLPFHAIREADSVQPTRTRVTLVYPIATANPSARTDDGLPVRNVEPGTYATCGGTMSAASTEKAAFGGFPFIEYACAHREADGRLRTGIAFHGPITSAAREAGLYWSLLRGPVSHGCNRMLGEHVLELAHLIGFDAGATSTPVTVVAGFDAWHGRSVDVDYPAVGFARPEPARTFVFPTWQAVANRSDGSLSIEFPRWACESTRCDTMPPQRLDERTGGIVPLAIRCLPGFASTTLPGTTTSVCASATDLQGPFTRAAVAQCTSLKLGAFCNGSSWPRSFGLAARGADLCPRSTFFDALTGACIDGQDALGPFPRDLVERCVRTNTSRATCEGARWNRWVLADLQRRSAVVAVAVR